MPHELRDHMGRTVAYALDFVLDTLDFSPSELSLPSTEAELKRSPTADPLGTDLFAIVVWNDDKHSYDECVSHLRDAVGCTRAESREFTKKIDTEVRLTGYTSRYFRSNRQFKGQSSNCGFAGPHCVISRRQTNCKH